MGRGLTRGREAGNRGELRIGIMGKPFLELGFLGQEGRSPARACGIGGWIWEIGTHIRDIAPNSS